MEDAMARPADDDTNLLDILLVVLKRKKMIIGVTLLFAVTTAIISLIMTPIYEGTARIMPPQSDSAAGGLLAQMSGAIGLGGALQDQNSPELFVGILKGSTVADAIIDRFNLMEVFGATSRIDARGALAGIFTPDIDRKSGLVTIKVEDPEPQRAAEMANAIVEELSKLLKNLAVTSASRKRLFFEEQLKDTHLALARAEDSLRGFQESTGVLRLEEQAKAVLEGIAVLRAQVAAKEIEMKVMKTYATPYNRDFRRMEEELKGLKEQLKKLEAKGEGFDIDAVIPTQNIPMLGTQSLRKIREFKYQETLYEILVKQYEAARLEEAKDAVLVQVVDAATVPDKRSKPKRTLMVLIATVGGFFLAVFAAFVSEYLHRISNNAENQCRLQKIEESLPLEKIRLSVIKNQLSQIWGRLMASRKKK